jgi:hypothetical protein
MASEIISQKTWKTSTGKTVTVTGTITLSETINADGDMVEVSRCDINVDVEVEGHGRQGSWIKLLPKSAPAAKMGYTHLVGRLALMPEQVDIINSVRAAVESHPAWVAKQERIAKNRREIAELESRRGPGYCHKCHSYCYGDCK